MSLIAQQAYVKIIRKVTSIEQKDMEEKRVLSLYEDRVVTEHRQFPIEHVLDISYRKVGSSGGLLYLHTRSGVFSYTVKTSAEAFIKAFKMVKQHLKGC